MEALPPLTGSSGEQYHDSISRENAHSETSRLIDSTQPDKVQPSKCGLFVAITTLCAVILVTLINRICCNNTVVVICIHYLLIVLCFCNSGTILATFRRWSATTENNTQSSLQYRRLRHNSLITLALLLVGSFIFNIFHIIGVTKCLRDTERRFELPGSIIETIFIVLQFIFQCMLLIKPERFKGLSFTGNLILLILINNIILFVQYLDDTWSSFRLNDLGEFPFTKVCAGSTDSNKCYVNRNATSSSIYVNAYLYTFKTHYFIFSTLTMLPTLVNSLRNHPFAMDHITSRLHADKFTTKPKVHVLLKQSMSSKQDTNSSTRRWLKHKLKLVWNFITKPCFSLGIAVVIAVVTLTFNIIIYSNSFSRPLSRCNTTEGFLIEHRGLEMFTFSFLVFHLSLVVLEVFAVGFALKKANLKRIEVKDSDTLLLSFAALVHLVLIGLELAETTQMKDAHFLNIFLQTCFLVFHFLSIGCQSLVILHFLNAGRESCRYNLEVWLIIYIGVSNFAKWFFDIFFPLTVMVLLSDLDKTFFSIGSWWLIAKLIYPIVCFYRMVSAFLCCQGYIIQTETE